MARLSSPCLRAGLAADMHMLGCAGAALARSEVEKKLRSR